MTAAHISTLDLNLLRVLDALLREENVTRAARQLGLTQPAVSRALSRLREALGDPLFVRSRHGLVPTSRAVALKLPLARALEQLGAVLRPEPDFEPRSARQRFTLAMTDLTQAILLPGLLERMSTEAPGVDLALRGLPADLERELATGASDVIISPLREALPGVKRRVLLKERFLCLVREGHPVLARGEWSLQSYLALPHVLVMTREQPGEGLVGELLARKGLKRRVGLVLPTFLPAPAIIARTDMVFTAPSRLAKSLQGRFALRTLEPPFPVPSFDMAILWHEARDAEPAHRWLRSVVVETFKQL